MPHINRAVDDPLLDTREYVAYPYNNPVVGEKDLEKTLDLAGLRFSLDDFQKLSKGTYNAGELRLTSDGKLDIVNNHKTWTVFNNKSVDAADSFAIRVAFAKAMEAAGVDEKAMHGVRKALGLGDDDSMRGGKALMPLTRQEVRELIDSNIAAINARRSPGRKLQTYDQLHAGYSEQEKKDIGDVRATINRTGAGDVEIDNELADLIAVSQKNPSFKGLSEAAAEDYLEFIDELSTALERVRDEDERNHWRRENRTEHKVTVTGGATGMALALEGGNVVVETVSDGKRSRIPLGLTPGELQERLDHAQALLNEIATLEVNTSMKLGKDVPEEQAPKSEPPTIKDSGNNLDESGIQDDDDLIAEFQPPKGTGMNIRRSDASRDDVSVRDNTEVNEEPSPEERKLVAQQNLDTLAVLMARQYDFDTDVAADIIKQIEGWEDRLAECKNTGNPTRLADVDESLRDFLLENTATIQPLIDQALADKDA